MAAAEEDYYLTVLPFVPSSVAYLAWDKNLFAQFNPWSSSSGFRYCKCTWTESRRPTKGDLGSKEPRVAPSKSQLESYKICFHPGQVGLLFEQLK